MKKPLFTFLALCGAFLLFFLWNSSWHLPSQLIIKGRVDLPAEVRVSWDSGAGFNDMEAADLVFGNPVRKDRGGFIRIRRIGKRHPAAKSTDVWIKAIKRSEDDEVMTLARFASQENIKVTEDGDLHLESDSVVLTIPAGRKHTVIIFAMNEYSGFVEIEKDGDRRLYDLYAKEPQEKWIERGTEIFTPGNFTANVTLPRYDIQRLRIEAPEGLQPFHLDSVTIWSQRGEVSLPVQGRGLFSSISFLDVSRNTRQYCHPIHFLQQLAFAMICSYITFFLFRFVKTKGGVEKIFVENKRYVFWLMFLGGVFSFGSWLLVYWPGHFTSDSVHVWWAAKQPDLFLYDIRQ